MNKVLVLLLLTLVQSQSDAILFPDNYGQTLEDSPLEDWEGSELQLSNEMTKDFGQRSTSYKKRSPNDVLTRRSALDKNFMRFGRSDPADGPASDCLQPKIFRVGRGLKDNFIRFGRGAQDNFIRFGRGGKDGFIRFGRTDPENFFRSGKNVRDNFIRFGKLDKNFMRFGRDEIDNQDYPYNFESLERTGKAPKGIGNFIRFGKSGSSREGRNGTNFLRFGRKNSDVVEVSEPEDVDLERTKREAPEPDQKGKKEMKPETVRERGNRKRSAGFFEQPQQDFRRYPPVLMSGTWENFDYLRNSENSRATPFFPEYSRTYFKPGVGFMVESKRIGNPPQGGSNFIRFG